jgi:hypothetical protein
MNEPPRWLEKAKETYKFHRSRLMSSDNWTVAKTARALRRSNGSICEDLMIARALKAYEKQLENFSYAYEALEFIRKKQKEHELAELD